MTGKHTIPCINLLNRRRADWALFATRKSKRAKEYQQKLESYFRAGDVARLSALLDKATQEFK